MNEESSSIGNLFHLFKNDIYLRIDSGVESNISTFSRASISTLTLQIHVTILTSNLKSSPHFSLN